MDWNRIEQLIDAYYEGETTLKEEKELREAFQRTDCPDRFVLEAKMIGFFEQEAKHNSSKLNYELEEKPVRTIFQSFILKYSGAAAAAILFFLFFYSKPKLCNEQNTLAVINNKRICDETIARQQVEDALNMISLKLNQSTSKFDK